MSRTLRRLAAVLALAALAFAQLAVAAYACPKGIDAPPRAEASVDTDAVTCPDGSTPNLCERHCEYGSSSVASQPAPVTAPDVAVLPWSATALAKDGSSLRAPARHLARIAAPPSSARLTPLRI